MAVCRQPPTTPGRARVTLKVTKHPAQDRPHA